MSLITERLDLLEARLKEPDFLRGAGLGNEVNFHIFDYPPELEPVVIGHLSKLKKSLLSHDIRVLHLDLFDLILEELAARNLLEKSFTLEETKGSQALLNALKNVLLPEKIVDRIRLARSSEHDLVWLTGVGAAFPLLRSHTVLNQLHSLITEPLVLFFPGSYNGARLELFGAFEDDHYYRAFQIVKGVL
jgi:hypothetical protein